MLSRYLLSSMTPMLLKYQAPITASEKALMPPAPAMAPSSSGTLTIRPQRTPPTTSSTTQCEPSFPALSGFSPAYASYSSASS